MNPISVLSTTITAVKGAVEGGAGGGVPGSAG